MATKTLCPRAVSIAAIWLLVSPAAAQTPAAAEFARDVLAFMDKHCVSCHGAKEPKGEIALHQHREPLALVKNRKIWERVRQMVSSSTMPPDDRPRPKEADVEAFLKSIKRVFDEHDRTAPPDPGVVTIRRLNRVEYNHTIRDLIGVDFHPADDFPADDVGHGFDNIGDVLSLSPVLMERYLAAAENIMERAIAVNLPPVPKRHLSCKYTEPAGADVSQARFRPISTQASQKPIETGPLFTSYMMEDDGEYVFRARVYAQAAEGQAARIAILGCGPGVPNQATDAQAGELSGLAVPGLRPFTILATREIKAADEKTAEVVEVPISRVPGIKRIAVALFKTPEGKPPATLHIEYFALEGPLDTRPASHRQLLAAAANQPQPAQTREVLRRFTRRAYRRPPQPEEVERLAKFVDQQVSAGEKWEVGMQRAMQAALVSPKFLFRVELDSRPDSPAAHALDEFQLASRLSYFLWSSMPDEELFALAEKQQLAAQLEPQVRRMLADPKSQALVSQFAMQWLQLGRLKLFAPDPKLFPAFNEPLRQAMLKETELFLGEVIRQDRSLVDLLAADFTYLNEPLARHYGLADTLGNKLGQKPTKPGGQPIRGGEFVRVSLQDGERGGLLTQASVLAVNSNPTRTSPVKRGRWILEQILGTPPPPPPGNVPELEQQAALTGSLRQRMEQHRANPACANCHARMDPIGFAFENYDAIGAFRVKDGEHEIDPSGTLPDGKAVAGPVSLKAILQEKKDLFAACLAEKMLTFALGRGLEYYDRRAVDRIQAALAEHEYRFSTLVVEIAKSDPFRLRRGKDTTP